MSSDIGEFLCLADLLGTELYDGTTVVQVKSPCSREQKKHCTSQSAFSSVAISAGIVFSLAFAGTFVPASATSVSESSAEAKLAPSAAETDPAATLVSATPTSPAPSSTEPSAAAASSEASAPKAKASKPPVETQPTVTQSPKDTPETESEAPVETQLEVTQSPKAAPESSSEAPTEQTLPADESATEEQTASKAPSSAPATAEASATAEPSPTKAAKKPSESPSPTASPSEADNKLLAPMAVGDVCSVDQASTQILGGFELDGNLCANDGALDDWTTVLTEPSGDDGFGDSTQFKSGASEASWPWTANQTQTPNSSPASGQADIGRNYAYSTTSDGHVFAFLGFERGQDGGTTGTIRYIVELNAEKNDPVVIPNPVRTDGDLRLSIEQRNNEPLRLAHAYLWDDSTDKWVEQDDPLSGFVGATNIVPIAGFDGTSTIPVRGFAEIGVDLTALFGEATCTGNYGTLNLRSSSSLQETSSLGDWIAPISLAVPSTCSSVIVDKNWVIDGEEFENGEQPDGIAATLELTGQTAPQFGTGYAKYSNGTDYEANDEIIIGESVAQLPAGCTNAPSGDLGEHVLQPGLNSYTVTNTVTCTTLTLEKEVIGEAAATEWTLSADGSSTDLSGVTGSEGVTNVPVTAGQYVISETGPENYQLTDLACEGAVVGDGNTITITAGSKATCVLTNTQEIDLTVTKTWVVNGTEYAHGEQPAGDAELSIDGQATEFGATSSGHLIGDEVVIEETLTGTLPELCTVTRSTIDDMEGESATHTMTETPSPNVVAIVNTVDCEQHLTLVKVVENEDFNGTSTTGDWTLTATDAVSNVIVASGKTGDDTVRDAKVPIGNYALSENGPAGYAAGEWTCEGTGSYTDGKLNLELGQEATCTIVNTAQPGSITWFKTDPSDNLLSGSIWTLTRVTQPNDFQPLTVADCIESDPAACTGPDKDPMAGQFTLENLPWGSYELDEKKAPAGYYPIDEPVTFEITGADLNKGIERSATVNKLREGPAIPLTGGLGRDFFAILGGGTVLIAAVGTAAIKLRQRRKGVA